MSFSSFNTHSRLVGQHAFLGASKYHWINYDLERLTEVWHNAQQAQRGVELHALAHQLVRLGVKLPKNGKTLNSYVNDAIGFRMKTEQLLVYSINCFGTADAISFSKDLLRIHDLKTGLIAGNMNQLKVYAAIFCHEYGIKPGEIDFELRIYQSDEVIINNSGMDEIAHIMSKIVVFDQHIERLKEGG
jgi:hypothetical protein